MVKRLYTVRWTDVFSKGKHGDAENMTRRTERILASDRRDLHNFMESYKADHLRVRSGDAEYSVVSSKTIPAKTVAKILKTDHFEGRFTLITPKVQRLIGRKI